jgi:1-acyl-sn-glycerol-3-phosphate acyltransferase
MPDMKPQVYLDNRPAEYFDEFHEQARKGAGWTYTVARILLTLPFMGLYRVRVHGLRNVPKRGAAVLTPNHFSQADHFFAGIYIFRRKLRFMGKSQLFGPPVLTYILKHGGVFPVRRGHRDEEAMKTAFELIDQGELLLVYAEGGRQRSGRLGRPKPGIGRIALETGVPIIPVAIYGSAGARAWKRLRFPQVTIAYGEPITFAVEPEPSRQRQLETAQEIFDEVKRMYGELARSSVARSASRTPDRARA